MEEPSIPYNYTIFLDKSGKLIKKTGYFFKGKSRFKRHSIGKILRRSINKDIF